MTRVPEACGHAPARPSTTAPGAEGGLRSNLAPSRREALRRLSGAAAFAVAGMPGVTAPGAAAGGRVRVAAHRGGAALWPENSLLAHRNALGLGVDFLETDVHLTADGEVVVVHDATLDRTTTGRGPVRALTLADLAGVTLRGADGAPTDERLPRLADLLDLVRPSRAELLLEIKIDASRRRYAGIEEKVLALVKDRGLLGRTSFMGFQAETVRRIGELEPSAATVLLVARSRLERQRVEPREAVRWTTEAGARRLGVQHTALDATVIDAARKAGIAVAAWTVNEEPDMRRVIRLGVDVLISDRPDVALRVLGR
jgi:glycerophosphoryl diester phosphodiesterase